jgi:hypothetical protein
MKVQLVFYDWMDIKNNLSMYHTQIGLELTMGDFHGGTVFEAEIDFEDYQGEIAKAKEVGIVPVFYLIEGAYP